MIPLLFAAAVTLSTPGLQKDLQAPVRNALDPAAPAPLSKDLHGQTGDAAQGSVRTWVLPLGAMPPLASLSQKDRDTLAFSGKLCQNKAVQTLGPDHSALKKLGELPPGLEEHAVNRIVDGCPVREIVSGGSTYYLDVPAPALERLDPVARITKER